MARERKISERKADESPLDRTVLLLASMPPTFNSISNCAVVHIPINDIVTKMKAVKRLSPISRKRLLPTIRGESIEVGSDSHGSTCGC